MRFIICGAGAIGRVIGGQLAKTGREVIFLEKLPEHVSAIEADGELVKHADIGAGRA
jgi:ketopantoate reductase